MREGGGGPPNTVRTRDKIAATATAITTPVNTESAAHLQGAQRSAPMSPARSLAERRSAELRRVRRRRMAEIVWRLGARAFFEFIDELDRHHGLDDDLDRRLEKYATADPKLIALLGGDQFPAGPTRIFGGGR
jgi:hypothetical protein